MHLMRAIDLSHDPKRKSWVSSANAPDGDFPIQNLPFCAFRRARSAEEFRGGVAIGDSVLDLGALHELGVLDGPAAHSLGACAQPFLNALMGLGPEASSALRAGLSAALRIESTLAPRLRPLLIPQEAAEYRVAAQVGDYTDFYASIHHATAVGKLLRPDNPLFPNYKWLPVAYHGRASSIRVSGYDFARPAGQVLPPGAALPELAATRRLDYELEVGVFVGRGNELGRSVPLREAESHL
ncbi:MAG: fumarylacetoacetase, partial [Gammaproteobacteria bacterium]